MRHPKHMRRQWPKTITTLVALTCPECDSISVVNNGRRKNMHEYKCSDCEREFYLLIEGRYVSLCTMKKDDEW